MSSGVRIDGRNPAYRMATPRGLADVWNVRDAAREHHDPLCAKAKTGNRFPAGGC